ncbi:glycine cleavage system protein GcvH [Raoultibacter timonensis]|uniref:Glycine cleavage system H protein n=1 Tax=Raoultibacter timonensis TaxID=1907662 RepID=A0ABN6MLQ7_9ACTN|nr:glycine cleavage system protein GcvH [Raoultibacter timonensis]BDE97591.1 glycine cleavage system H protein [Raoultibacter timonensis]BDF52194.1 glycine cleavage system H protein [Raoultibacter timonensis]
MDYPADRMYTETHEWVAVDGENATIGLTDYAQKELGDLVFVGLPEVGDELVGGEPFADVESVKAVSEVISPVDGTVVEVNEELLDNPALINESAWDAWLVRVEPASIAVETMDAPAYAESCAQ